MNALKSSALLIFICGTAVTFAAEPAEEIQQFRRLRAEVDADTIAQKRMAELHETKRQAAAEAALKIATTQPESTEAFVALEWWLEDPQNYRNPDYLKVLKILEAHHLKRADYGAGLAMAVYWGNQLNGIPLQRTTEFFEHMQATNSDATVRGMAKLGLARLALSRYHSADHQKTGEVEKFATAAERAYDELLKTYGDLAFPIRGDSKKTIGDLARGPLNELRSLRIGQKVPDIVGIDTANKDLRLSDYRGKVTLLVFWATWCGPCMRELPIELALLKKFEGRPFAIVGINADDDLEEATRIIKKYNIPWRSFQDERPGQESISRSWNVTGFPTVCVIDDLGVLRSFEIEDEAIENLVKAAETRTIKNSK